MIKHHIVLIARNLFYNRTFSVINILGLAISITATVFILQYVLFEKSYDQFHTDVNRIYRVYNDRYQEGELIQHGTITYSMVGPSLAADYPEVAAYTRIMPAYGGTGFTHQDQVFLEESGLFVDEHFFSMFDFEVIAGDPSNLAKPNTIAISTELAKKYFDLSDNYDEILGSILTVSEDQNPCQIQAVFTPIPENSHLQFDFTISFATLIQDIGPDRFQELSRRWSDFYHYIKLHPEVKPRDFAQQLQDFEQKYFPTPEISGGDERFYLQPLSEAHLYSDFEYEIGVVNNGQAIHILIAIAMFILLIAWINYINLTSARALERAKEVGVRKVLGANTSQLIRQFMSESFVYHVMGLIIGITLVQILQPFFNNWIDKPLSLFSLFTSNGMLLLLVSIPLVWIVGVLISGYYPARVLTYFQPVSVMKGKFTRSSKGQILRKGLVVFQFTCSLLLIIATLTVYRQLNFMQDKELGMNLDQKIVIQGPQMSEWDSTFIERSGTLKASLRSLPGIHQVASSHRLAGDRLPRLFEVNSARMSPEQHVTTSRMDIDDQFIPTYDIALAAGRNFVPADYHTDFNMLHNLMLNESAVRLLGYNSPEEILSQEIDIYGKIWTVVGVVEDFHQQSLRNPIEPIVFFPAYSTYDYFTLKVTPANLENLIPQIEAKFQHIFPGNAFTYFFIDQRFEEQYMEDKRFGQIFAFFTLLAILIACLGLFGLSSYSYFQRSKEVGIRKVLGASLNSILVLLSKEFVSLIGIATLIALPLGYILIRNWLAGYAYHMAIDIMIFMVPALLLIGIAILTIGYQTLKVAHLNPVEILKDE